MADPDKIKSRLAQKGIGAVAVQEPPAQRPIPLQGNAGPAPPFSKPKPAVVGTEQVKAACGHEVLFELFDDKKDKFRKERRKKVTDRPCPACRERKRIEEEPAAKLRRAEKQQRREQSPPPRLPDRARFEVVYDASQKRWAGTLTIGEGTFTDSASAVFKLLRRLDNQYRQSVEQRPGVAGG